MDRDGVLALRPGFKCNRVDAPKRQVGISRHHLDFPVTRPHITPCFFKILWPSLLKDSLLDRAREEAVICDVASMVRGSWLCRCRMGTSDKLVFKGFHRHKTCELTS